MRHAHATRSRLETVLNTGRQGRSPGALKQRGPSGERCDTLPVRGLLLGVKKMKSLQSSVPSNDVFARFTAEPHRSQRKRREKAEKKAENYPGERNEGFLQRLGNLPAGTASAFFPPLVLRSSPGLLSVGVILST